MAFLRRLSMLVGFVFSWFIFSITIPWLFAFVGAAILGAAVFHMVRAKKRHSPGMLFSTFGGFTLVFSALSLGMSMSGSSAADEGGAQLRAQAANEETVEEASAENEAKEVEPEEPTAPEKDDAQGEAVPEESAPAPAPDPSEVVAGVKAFTKDKARCTNIDAVAELWTQLSQIKKGDPLFKKAVKASKKVERCRKKAAKKLPKKQRKAMLAEKGMAKALRLK